MAVRRAFAGFQLPMRPQENASCVERTVGSDDTPTASLEGRARASDGKSKESGLASEQSRRRFVLCPRQHRKCGAAAVQARSLRMRDVAVAPDKTRGKPGRRSAQGVCLGLDGGRLEIVLIFRPKLARKVRARQIRVSVVPASSFQVPHHIHRMTLRIPSPDVAEEPDGVIVSSCRHLTEPSSVDE